MGAYQEGVVKNKIGEAPVTAHIYEYSTQSVFLPPFLSLIYRNPNTTFTITIAVSVTPSMKIEGPERGVVPVQLVFCLKEKNQRNSTHTGGSSMPSGRSSSPTSTSSSTSAPCPGPPPYTTSGKHSTSTPTSGTRVARSSPSRESTGGICRIP